MPNFALLQTPDYFTGGVNALQAGQQAQQARQRRNVLATYGTDPSGARNALIGLGDVETAGQLQGLEANQQSMARATAQEGRAVAQEGRAVSADERAAATAQLQQAQQINGVLVNAAQAVAKAPAERRDAYFDSIVPELQRMGVPDEAIQHMRVAPKDDAALQQFEQLLGQQAQEIEYQFINLGDGGVARGRKDTGELTTLREPRPQPFAMDPDKTYIDSSSLGAGQGSSSNSGITTESLTNLVGQVAPGARITSGQRTAEHNAEVGGVANSYHLTGQAVDVVPPQGMTTAQLAAAIRASGQPLDVIDEGSHVHLEPAPVRVAQGGAQGPRVLQQAQPRQANAPVGFRYKPDGTLEFVPGGPADPAVSASARNLRPVPAGVVTGLTGNRQALANIDKAIELIQQDGAALGAHNYIPGGITDRLPGAGNSGGVQVRAALAGISSQRIHDLSGAAVTASEFPRLRPYIPLATDPPAVAITKLENMKREIQQLVEQTQASYGPDTGYRELTPPSGSTIPASAAPTAPRGNASSLSDAEIKAQLGLP